MTNRYDIFRRYQGVLAFLHLASSSVFLYIVSINDWDNDWAVPLEINFNRWERMDTTENSMDEQCSPRNPCLVTKYVDSNYYPKLSLGAAIASCSYISGLHHLAAFLAPMWYKSIIQSSVVWPRWLDYAFSSPVMFLVVSILWVAPPDLRDVIYGFCLQFLVILGGYAAEVIHSYNTESRHKWAITAGASSAYLAIWAYLFRVFGAALGNDGERACNLNFEYLGLNAEVNTASSASDPPPFVFAILFGIFFTFSFFAVTHYWKLLKGNPRDFDSNLRYEAAYSVLSFTSKIILLGTMATTIVSRSDGSVLAEGQEAEPESDADPNAAYYGLAGSSGVALLFAAVFSFSFFRATKMNEKSPSPPIQPKIGKLMY